MEPKLQGEKLVKCPRRSEGISQSYKPIKSENPNMNHVLFHADNLIKLELEKDKNTDF